MSSVITVRGIDPGDKSWLKREARHKGVSMEELVRRLIREQRRGAVRGAHVDVRLGFEQLRDQQQVALVHCVHQRSATATVTRVHVRPGCKRRLQHCRT